MRVMCFVGEGEKINQISNKMLWEKVGVLDIVLTQQWKRMSSTFTLPWFRRLATHLVWHPAWHLACHWIACDSDGVAVNLSAIGMRLAHRCFRCCYPLNSFYQIYHYCVDGDFPWANLFCMNDGVWMVWMAERWPPSRDQNSCPEYRSVHCDSPPWSLPTLKWSQLNHPMKNQRQQSNHDYKFECNFWFTHFLLFGPDLFQALQIESLFSQHTSECDCFVAMV